MSKFLGLSVGDALILEHPNYSTSPLRCVVEGVSASDASLLLEAGEHTTLLAPMLKIGWKVKEAHA